MNTIFWMIILLGVNFGSFIFFANIAARNEKSKREDNDK
jgi:hypothetical protein